MKKNLTIFLQVLIIALGISVLVFMLWEPNLEGRNASATLFQVYFNDPFLAYVYISSIAFFVALYQAFKMLGYVRKNREFSQETTKALAIINYCMKILLGLIVVAEAMLFLFNDGKDDIAGGVFMGLLAIVLTGGIAVVANRFQKKIYGHNN